MIHYHGTPLTPRSQLRRMTGKHFCVSFANPSDAQTVLKIGQSVMWDNGAFTSYTKGKIVDLEGYYKWLEPLLGHPHWAVIPDIIDGSVKDQQKLVSQWPFGFLGAPVWHMAEPMNRLLELADSWPRICFGSSGIYWNVGSEAWRERADIAFNELIKRHSRLPWIHMMRGLALCGNRWPFASSDSANVARNYSSAKLDPVKMANRIDAKQRPIKWTPRNNRFF